MGRPIGQRIKEACRVVELLGPCKAVDVFPLMTNVTPNDNAGKYCERAVLAGLMTAEGKNGHKIYTVTPSWRELSAQRIATRPPEVKRRPHNGVYQVSSRALPVVHELQRCWA